MNYDGVMDTNELLHAVVEALRASDPLMDVWGNLAVEDDITGEPSLLVTHVPSGEYWALHADSF